MGVRLRRPRFPKFHSSEIREHSRAASSDVPRRQPLDIGDDPGRLLPGRDTTDRRHQRRDRFHRVAARCVRALLQIPATDQGVAVRTSVVSVARDGGGIGQGQAVRRVRELLAQGPRLRGGRAGVQVGERAAAVQAVPSLSRLVGGRLDTSADRAIRGELETHDSGAVAELPGERLG